MEWILRNGRFDVSHLFLGGPAWPFGHDKAIQGHMDSMYCVYMEVS